MNIKRFAYMCKLSQKNLKKHVYTELKNTHEDIIFKDGFIYAKGTFPVLLVAHLDTVHKNLPIKIYHDKNKHTMSSPEGIGGDDRCGVYMILEILKKYNCSVVFCEDEEIGGIGASKFVQYILDNRVEDIDNFKYVLELDRKGSTDAVFYDCDNDEFEDFVTQEYFKTSYGTFSDISFICPYLCVAGVNLSSGYYNAHTLSEYVVTTEVDTIVENVCKMLDRTNEDTKQFEYVERVYRSKYTIDDDYAYYYGNRGEYDYGDSDSYYRVEYNTTDGGEVEYIVASGYEECIGKFLMRHEDLTFRDVLYVEQEY